MDKVFSTIQISLKNRENEVGVSRKNRASDGCKLRAASGFRKWTSSRRGRQSRGAYIYIDTTTTNIIT